jgi:hypothetical protein
MPSKGSFKGKKNFHVAKVKNAKEAKRIQDIVKKHAGKDGKVDMDELRKILTEIDGGMPVGIAKLRLGRCSCSYIAI